MIILSNDLIANLISQPESGMGFQIVEAEFDSYKKETRIALNAEYLLDVEEAGHALNERTFVGLIDKYYSSKTFSEGAIRSLRVITKNEKGSALNALRESSVSYLLKSVGAIDAPMEFTLPDERFKRFSPFPNDRRLQADGSWVSGTFATTEKDAALIKSGMDAVMRYALPSDLPANNVFTGTPHRGTQIQRGIVVPVAGKSGGGIEVYFPNGTQPKTVTGPDVIPET